MARLPQPGGDSGNWGNILNDYLSTSHKGDGTLKDSSVGPAQLQDNAVTASSLASSSVTNTKLAADTVAKSQLQPALRTEIDDKLTQAVADNRYASIPQSTTAPASPAVGSLWLDTSSTAALKRWDGTTWLPVGDFGPSGAVIMATPKWYPGIDVTGATSASTALNAIFAAAPAGATVKLVGTYLINANVVVDPTKFLTIDCSAATFLLSGSGTKFSCTGGFEAPFTVSAITTEALVVENKTRTFTKLTVDSTPPWKVGDIVKIIADDVIPAGHVTSATVKPRVGEFAVVHRVTGTTVYLKSPLIETYATNIRTARLIPGSVTLIQPTVDVTDVSVAAKQSSNFFRCQSLIMPQVIRPTFRRLTGMGLSMKSNYGYVVDNGTGLYAMDDTDTGNYGYFVHDSSCQSGRMVGGDYTGGRHAYTDGTADTEAGSTDFASYGASINFKAIGVTSRATTAACWDTHHNSIGAEFIDCSAYPLAEEDGFLLRGRNHRVVNPKVYGGATVLYVVTQDTGTWSQGESYGHELINPWSDGTRRIVVVNVRGHANHPNVGVRQEIPNLTVHGGTHTNAQRRAVVINGWVDFVSPGMTRLGSSAEGAIYEATNSILTIRDETVDASAVTTVGAGTQRVIFANDSDNTKHSIVRVGHLAVSASATYIAAAAVPVECLVNTERFDFDDLLFESPWPSSTPVAVPDSTAIQTNVRWRFRNVHASSSSTQRSSHVVTFTNTQIAGSHRNLARSIDDNLLMLVDITDATPRTLSQLWLGKFVGQRLTIFRVGTGSAITVVHGAAGRTSFSDATNKSLATAGDSLSLIWTGTTWSQA